MGVEVDKADIYGNTLIILALEIVYAMANWYPVSYFDEEPSVFAQMYKKLKDKGVIFPPVSEFEFMKEEEKKVFLANHQKWKQRMEA